MKKQQTLKIFGFLAMFIVSSMVALCHTTAVTVSSQAKEASIINKHNTK